MRAGLLALILAFSLALAGSPASAKGPLGSRLHDPAARPDVLYVVLFSLPDCPYCVAIRDAYLPALPDDPRFRERVRIREVSISSPRPITDFDGTPARQADIASLAHASNRVIDDLQGGGHACSLRAMASFSCAACGRR